MHKINTQKTLGIQTINCPVCNKQPTVIVDIEMFNAGIREHVTVKCHRLFRRKHLKVYGHGNTPAEAAINGIRRWNEAVCTFNQKG